MDRSRTESTGSGINDYPTEKHSQGFSIAVLSLSSHTGAETRVEYLVQRSRKRNEGELKDDNCGDRRQDAPGRLWVEQHAAAFRGTDHHTPVGTGVGHDTQKHQTGLLVNGVGHFEDR